MAEVVVFHHVHGLTPGVLTQLASTRTSRACAFRQTAYRQKQIPRIAISETTRCTSSLAAASS